MPEVFSIPRYDFAGTRVFTTAHGTDHKLSVTAGLEWHSRSVKTETDVVITVVPTQKFQTIIGIGAAITDASAHVLYQLPHKTREQFLKAHFSMDDGIGYSLIRTTIHSCDFSPASYTYVEKDDVELSTFSIAHDLEKRIPFIKSALDIAGDIPVYASPWSPPAFMKTNANMLQGGQLKPEFNKTWADYFVNFVENYEEAGVPIWGVTVQNKPAATQRWESCTYTAEQERDFVKNFLGAAFAKAELSQLKIIIWDHNRDLMLQRANIILSDPEAAKYVWGTGFHWYEDWKDGIPMYENVGKLKEAYPDKELIFTEGCNENYDPRRLEQNDPSLAERYAKSMIHDFNNGTVAWTDWNILLDERGGPNHVGNYCFAPVHADTATGKLNFTWTYYYLGHFSKFIRPGARRISSASSNSKFLATAFENSDGSLAVVVCNTDHQSRTYSMEIEDQETILTLSGHSIQTITINSSDND